jgi:hypothetical protein
LLNPDDRGAENQTMRLSRGEPTTPTRRSKQVKARMYRAALMMGVVAVFLEGLGAYLKW